MSQKLCSLANVHSGIVLSRKEAPREYMSAISYKRLTLRSVSETGSIIKEELEDYLSRGKIDSLLLTQSEDILVRLCMPINPVYVEKEHQGVIVPSQIAVIRINDTTKIMPEYLRWYLSQKSVSDALQAAEHGTAQRTIKVKSILGLDIEVPPLNIQQQIGQIDILCRQRERLYQNLMIQERLQMEKVLASIMGGNIA